MQNSYNSSFQRLPKVLERTGLSRSSLYDKLDEKSPRYDVTFPRPVHLSERSIAFSEQEITEWIENKLAARCQGGV